MEYLLMFYGDENALANIPPEELAARNQERFTFDEAIQWAGKMPNLPSGGSVEVRPVWVFQQ